MLFVSLTAAKASVVKHKQMHEFFVLAQSDGGVERGIGGDTRPREVMEGRGGVRLKEAQLQICH